MTAGAVNTHCAQAIEEDPPEGLLEDAALVAVAVAVAVGGTVTVTTRGVVIGQGHGFNGLGIEVVVTLD